jgi:hypothetical protein
MMLAMVLQCLQHCRYSPQHHHVFTMPTDNLPATADDFLSMYPDMDTLRASMVPEEACPRPTPWWLRWACRISWWIKGIVDIFVAFNSF